MKKLLLLFAIFIMSFSLYASLGYTVSGNGYSSSTSFGGIGLSFLYEIDNTPVSIEVGGSVGISTPENFNFLNASAKVKVYPFSFVKHPFSFMFQNDVFYRPLLIAGYDYYHLSDSPSSFHFGLSLLSFEDVHYRYSYLSPYINISAKGDINGWGIELIKMSYVF